MVARAPAVMLVVSCLHAAALAHGGQYRGPGDAVPTGGAPGAGPRAGPNTGGRPPAPAASWQVWWEFNKEPLLGPRRRATEQPVTGSDDFYLGQRRPEASVDLLAPTEADLREGVVPALAALLEAERSRDIQSACLIALGKIGRDGDGVDLESVLASRLRRNDQEVRESAALALGIAGRMKAMPILEALVRDTSAGRRLVDRAEVGDRTRAFAAYGLGELARRNDDPEIRQHVHDLLLPLLTDPEADDRDLRVAAVTALGLLGGGDRPALHKRLAWQTVDELLVWYQRDLGSGDEWIQAHAPVAIARLLGRGSSVLHQRCKEHFAAVLTASPRRSNQILQSAALALGMLAAPPETEPDDAPFSRALQSCYEDASDRHARSFALIALARIGGPANRTWLATRYTRDRNATERPWVAIALGLVGRAAWLGGEVDATIAQLLREDLEEVANADVRASLAVAIGLCGDDTAVPLLLRLLHENEGDERQAGYYCVALALLGDARAVPALEAVIERSVRRPFLLQQAAVALGRLGDKKASLALLELIARSESTAVLSALATAIGQIGDRRSIDPLIELTRDTELTKLARAFVAAALGGIGDKDELPWNVPISRDGNYAAAVDTLTNGSTGVLDIL